jgi:hypothetical protein
LDLSAHSFQLVRNIGLVFVHKIPSQYRFLQPQRRFSSNRFHFLINESLSSLMRYVWIFKLTFRDILMQNNLRLFLLIDNEFKFFEQQDLFFTKLQKEFESLNFSTES